MGAKDTILTLAHIGCLIHIVECSLRNNYILQAPVLLGGGGGAAAGGTMSQECLAAVLLQVRKVLNLQYCTVTLSAYCNCYMVNLNGQYHKEIGLVNPWLAAIVLIKEQHVFFYICVSPKVIARIC